MKNDITQLQRIVIVLAFILGTSLLINSFIMNRLQKQVDNNEVSCVKDGVRGHVSWSQWKDGCGIDKKNSCWFYTCQFDK